MFFPVFSNGGETALEVHPDGQMAARDAALLYHALRTAIEGAFRFGLDFPVGAVAASGQYIIGEYYASDKRTRLQSAHAEFMAVAAAKADRLNPHTDTVAVTLEPCDDCQDFLVDELGIKRIIFGLPRTAAVSRKLVKAHESDIYERLARKSIEVTQVDDDQLQTMGELLLNCTVRDLSSGVTTIDTERLSVGISQASLS